MATLLEQHGAIITLDYLPVWQGHNVLHGFHTLQGQSMDYAIEHGGYAVTENEADIRGYMAYLLIKNRRGYGIDGWVVRSIENMQAISLSDGSMFANDYLFAEEIAAPALKAIRYALNYTTGNLAIINNHLDSWVMTVAARFKLNPDDI